MKKNNNLEKIKSYSGDRNYTEKYNEEVYVAFRKKESLRLIDQIKLIKPFHAGDSVLDIGCGTGEMGLLIKEKFNSKVYGLDINGAAVKKANKNGIIARLGDVEKKWPYDNGSINSVLCVQMIEHLVNPDFFLEESKRVLKKNGLVIISTPNLAAWYNRLILLLGFQPFYTEVSTVDKTIGLSFTKKLTRSIEPMGHLRVFTLPALKEILELHGFEPILIKGSKVSYFPKVVEQFDSFFGHFPGLASDLVVVAKKK